MPEFKVNGYLVQVKGAVEKNESLPSLDGHSETCYTVMNSTLRSQYVFRITVISNDYWSGEEFDLLFNKTAVGYAQQCVEENFAVCNYKNPCNSNGDCHPGDSVVDYTCSCNTGWMGENCTVQNYCEYSPCENGGVCNFLKHNEFNCICGDTFYGHRCQFYNECLSLPCQNGGSCRALDNGAYTCACADGYSGQKCEVKDPCSPSPCKKDQGVCERLNDTAFHCDCFDGFYGNLCEFIDACSTQPCQYFGTCLPQNNTYSCVCPPGRTGQNCALRDPCQTSPCRNNGTCVTSPTNGSFRCGCPPQNSGNECQYTNYCYNVNCGNGTCNPLEKSFKCNCHSGYHGKNCEAFDICLTLPCGLNGQCNSGDDNTTDMYRVKYTCDCYDGWYGERCQLEDLCFHGACNNNGECTRIPPDKFLCHCYPGYNLKDCSVFDPCFTVQCQNGGKCRNTSATDVKCDCPRDWRGDRCEQEVPCNNDMADCICVDQHLQCPHVGEEENAGQKLNDLLDQTSDPARLTVQQVVNYTDQLMHLYNDTLTRVQYARIAMNVIGNLGRVNLSVSYAAEMENSTNTRLRAFIDDYTSEVNISVTGEVKISTNDLNIKAVMFDKVAGSSNYTFQTSMNNSDKNTMYNVSITLPMHLLNDTGELNSSRVQFVAYRRSQLFVPVDGFEPYGQKAGMILNQQRVISAVVKGRALENLTEPVVIQLPKIQAGVNHTCVYWDTALSNWSTEGIKMEEDEFGYVTCYSTHLTSFAVLLDVSPDYKLSKEHEDALTYITYIGCAISMACLAVTVLTYSLFRCLNNDKSGKILIQLGVSLLILNIIFLVGSVDVSQYSDVGCVIVAILLHYFILAAFMWMLVEAIEMYHALVTVFSKYEGYYLVKRCLFAWGVPLAIVGITAAVDIGSYHNENIPRDVCFLTSRNAAAYYASLIAPCCVIIVINTVVFIMVSRVILKPKFQQQQQLMNDSVSVTPAQFRGAFTVMFLLGITWVFGPLAINEAKLVFSYIFCICNSLQGFLIFVFRCLLNPEAKLAWLQLYQTGTLKRRRGPIKSVYSDSSSKGADINHRRLSNSNVSGLQVNQTGKSNKGGNSSHPHPHQIHTTNGWHPNLNGNRSEKSSHATQGFSFSMSPHEERRSSVEYSIATKRESIPNDSVGDFQDQLTHF
ncbi:adhesion G protein-coupled receptor L4-like [Physella acuta]|uniref:adhesion G protein-coupled receptor L4-like n=1 Tax=Physella acuta TaxID=109671 RepID=UPI0027DAE1BF|nr:adhesion G protein-coupled receptor L4-like [Physella acuta]